MGVMVRRFMKLDNRLNRFREKMDLAIVAYERDLTGIRTGRANPAIVENIKVEAYGNLMPINQLASVSVTDPRTLVISVWDNSIVKVTADAIRDCGQNFNPMVDGQNIKITLVPLTQERRNELCKLASKSAENAKITLRNVRHEALDFVKNLEKNKEITEDEKKRLNNEIQALLDEFNSVVDKKLKDKQTLITEI